MLNCFTHSVKEVFKYLILADLQPSTEAAPSSHFLGVCICTASPVSALTVRDWVVRTPGVLGEMRPADMTPKVLSAGVLRFRRISSVLASIRNAT